MAALLVVLTCKQALQTDAAAVSVKREERLRALARVRNALKAYRRGDQFEMRRELLEAWATYCEPENAGRVVKLKRKG